MRWVVGWLGRETMAGWPAVVLFKQKGLEMVIKIPWQ